MWIGPWGAMSWLDFFGLPDPGGKEKCTVGYVYIKTRLPFLDGIWLLEKNIWYFDQKNFFPAAAGQPLLEDICDWGTRRR